MHWFVMLLFGRFGTTIQRRVSDEEQITISYTARTIAQANEWARQSLTTLREHMIEHNQRVITQHNQQIELLSQKLVQTEMRFQDKYEKLIQLETRLKEIQEQAHPMIDVPFPHDGDAVVGD